MRRLEESQVTERATQLPLVRRAGLLARIYRHRADYLYVLPAISVMLLVIAYPIYYTIHLSFFNATQSGARRQDFCRAGKLFTHPCG